MNNLKNEGDSPFILQRSTPKPLETRQIPLGSPCPKCGESSGKLGASQVNRLPKGTPVYKRLISTASEQLALPLTNEGGES
jgi:hypothetical protein